MQVISSRLLISITRASHEKLWNKILSLVQRTQNVQYQVSFIDQCSGMSTTEHLLYAVCFVTLALLTLVCRIAFLLNKCLLHYSNHSGRYCYIQYSANFSFQFRPLFRHQTKKWWNNFTQSSYLHVLVRKSTRILHFLMLK